MDARLKQKKDSVFFSTAERSHSSHSDANHLDFPKGDLDNPNLEEKQHFAVELEEQKSPFLLNTK